MINKTIRGGLPGMEHVVLVERSRKMSDSPIRWNFVPGALDLVESETGSLVEFWEYARLEKRIEELERLVSALEHYTPTGSIEDFEEGLAELEASDGHETGCTVDEDICSTHDEPLICEHGCSEAKPHNCKDETDEAP